MSVAHAVSVRGLSGFQMLKRGRVALWAVSCTTHGTLGVDAAQLHMQCRSATVGHMQRR